MNQGSLYPRQKNPTARGQCSELTSREYTCRSPNFCVDPNPLPRLLLNKEKLRSLLHERNLPVSGNKPDLLKRLQDFSQQPDQWERQVVVIFALIKSTLKAPLIPLRMLRPTQRKQRGRFTSKKLSGAAKRAEHLFQQQDPYASLSQESTSLTVTDRRADIDVQMQEQMVLKNQEYMHHSVHAKY